MYKHKTIVALITARGGSRRLPNKNIKRFLGKPLIAWTIRQALASKYIDRIIVSTDSKKIADISKRYGAEAPFLRPKKIATDNAKSMDAVVHAIEWLRNKGQSYDLLILLQPTSPLRKKEDIDKSIELLFSKKAQAVISVCKVDHHPYWSNKLPGNGRMNNFIHPDAANKSSRELKNFYRLNGATFLGYCDYLKKQKSFLGSKTYAYIMPKERSVDIDDEIDFNFAEFYFRQGKPVK